MSTTLYAADTDPFSWYRSPPPSSMSFMDFSCSSSGSTSTFPLPRNLHKKKDNSKPKKRKVMVMRRPLPLSLDPVLEDDEDALADEEFYSGGESHTQETQRSKARPRRREATVWPEDDFQIMPDRLTERRGSDDDISQSLSMLQFPMPPASIPEPSMPTKRAAPPLAIEIFGIRRGSDGSPLSPIDPEMPISPLRPSREPETPYSPSFNPISHPTSPTFFSPLFNGFDPSPSSTPRRPSIASLEPRVQHHTRQHSDSSVSSGVSEVNTDDCIESWDAAIDEIYRMADDPASPTIDSLPNSFYGDLIVPQEEETKPASLSRSPASSFPHKRKQAKRCLASRRGAAPSPLNLNRPPPSQTIPSPPFSPAESIASRKSRSSYVPTAPSKLRKSLEVEVALAAEWLRMDDILLDELADEKAVERVLSMDFPPTPISPPRKSAILAAPKSILRNANSAAFPTSPTSPMSVYSPFSNVFSSMDPFPLSPTTPASTFTFSHSTLPLRRKGSNPPTHQRPATLRSKRPVPAFASYSDGNEETRRSSDYMSSGGSEGRRSRLPRSPTPVELLIR